MGEVEKETSQAPGGLSIGLAEEGTKRGSSKQGDDQMRCEGVEMIGNEG